MGGWSSTRRVSTEPTMWTGHSSPPSVSALTARRTRSILHGQKDASGEDFDAASKKYVLHFDKGQMPPVDGFWSLTMYDKDYFFVPNPLNRYTLERSATSSTRTLTARLTFTSRPTRQARQRKPTGCPRRRPSSFLCCVCIGRRKLRRRSSTEPGSRRQSRWRSK